MAVIETKEVHEKELLKTHYYKASYEQIKQIYLEILKSLKHNIISVNDDFGEISWEVRHLTCRAKIIMQTPNKTSIDFYINSEYLFMSSAKAYKFIKEVLQRIQNKYELKGLGLHA